MVSTSQSLITTPRRGYPPASVFPSPTTLSHEQTPYSTTPHHQYETAAAAVASGSDSIDTTSSSSSSSSSATSVNSSADQNRLLARIHIPVEWFFGRLKRIWLRLGSKYTSPRDDLPSDLKIACFLTNLSILYKAGTPEDVQFYEHEAIVRRSDRNLEEEINSINANARQQREEARRKYRMGREQSRTQTQTESQSE